MHEYVAVDGLTGVHTIQKGNLRSTAFYLADDSVCVVSPIAGLPAEAYTPLGAEKQIKHALAPNHFHHKGLDDFVQAFPKAKIYAPEAAIDRLRGQNDLSYNPLSKLVKLLPKEAVIIETQGLKTGEVWVRFKQAKTTAWLVIDAFCGPKATAADKPATKPELLKPFPTYGVGNKEQYCAWAKQQIKQDKPSLLMPCHGSLVKSPTLAKDLINLVDTI